MAAAAGAYAVAEEGWDVPGSGGPFPAMLHPEEMVLPAPLAEGVRNMTTMQNFRSESTENNTSTGQPVQLHYHAGNIHALDKSGMEEALARHPAQLTKMVEGLHKSGRLDVNRMIRRVAP
jgi:hypothetical protein